MKRAISPDTKRELAEMFMPELHRARWAERWAELEDAKREAKTPGELAAVKAQLREHMKHEYDVAGTRQQIERELGPAAPKSHRRMGR